MCLKSIPDNECLLTMQKNFKSLKNIIIRFIYLYKKLKFYIKYCKIYKKNKPLERHRQQGSAQTTDG